MELEFSPLHFNKLIFFFFISIFFFTIGIHFFLKNPRFQANLAKAFILLIVVVLCAYGVKKSLQFSEKLSIYDSAELITINAAYNYAENGFTLNYGLPDFRRSYYYIDYDNKGRDKLARVSSSKTPIPHIIYTHLPPAPWWIAGIFVKVCGNSTLSCPRILSTITSCLALLFLGIMSYSALGPLKSIVLMFFVTIIPITRYMVYTLHYHNYAFSIFLILLGFLLHFFKQKRKFNISTAIILFILGFVQGWVAYEYVFLISLSSIPFALLYSQPDKKEDRKKLFYVILFLVIGFCSAVGLHFIQNSLYFGSIMEAFNDLFERGKTRLLSNKPAGWTRETDRIQMSLWYFFVMPRSWFFFIINFHIFLSVCLILIWFKDVSITIKKPINISIKWISPRRNYFVILIAFLASYLWIFTMFNQVASEGPHMARILFFLYFICILTILECIRSASPK